MDKCLENWNMFRQFRFMKPIFLRTLWQRARLVRGPVGLPLLSSNMVVRHLTIKNGDMMIPWDIMGNYQWIYWVSNMFFLMEIPLKKEISTKPWSWLRYGEIALLGGINSMVCWKIHHETRWFSHLSTSILGQSTGWVETDPLVLWYQQDYLRSPAKTLFFCKVSKFGHASSRYVQLPCLLTKVYNAWKQ